MPILTAHDFMAPFFLAWIVRPDKKEFPLWLRPEKGGRYANVPDMACMDSASLELNMNGIPVMAASLSMNWDTGQQFLNSDLFEFGSNLLKFQYGYLGSGGKPVCMYTVEGLTQAPDVNIGVSDISVTLKGHGLSGNYLSQSSRTVPPLKDQKSRRDLIKLLAAPEVPKAVKFDVVFRPECDSDSEVKAALDEKIDANFADKSSMDAISELAWDAACQVLFISDRLEIIPISTMMGGGEGMRQFVHRAFPKGRLGPAANIFPILGVSVATPANYTSGALQGICVSDVDPRKVAVVEQYAGAADSKVSSTCRSIMALPEDKTLAALNTMSRLGRTQLPFSFIEDRAVSRRRLDMAWYDLAIQSGLKLTVETLFLPDLLPAETAVLHMGLMRYDGKYAIDKLTHSFSSSGFSTSFDCISNAGSLFAQARQAARTSEPSKALVDQSGKVRAGGVKRQPKAG